MTLQEAIIHSLKRATEDCSECAKEHEQLANWLIELRDIKKFNEHFNNPPLKFEDLKEGMWVWDNKEKEYVKCSPNKNLLGERCVWWRNFNLVWYGEYEEDYLIFEENRFYLREVKDVD